MNAKVVLKSPEATERLAARFAAKLQPGDVIGLIGGLGAGKSLFARAVIANLLAERGRREEIPSPSYALVQSYDLGDYEIWHADLYRLGDIGEIAELGLEEAFGKAICLVEWADRLGPSSPTDMLSCAFAFVPGQDNVREVTLHATGGRWDWLSTVLDACTDLPA